MGIVNVTHFETCAVATQTAWSQRAQTTLVRKFVERVRLLHELRELAGSEKCLHNRRDRARVNQIVRRNLILVAQTHSLANRAGHARETDAKLVSQQLANEAHATVPEMIDIVRISLTYSQPH